MSLDITVRDSVFAPVLPITPMSLEWRLRHLDVGGWTVVVPWNGDAAEALLTPGAGLTVTDDLGSVVLSGAAHVTAGGEQTAFRRELSVDGNGVPVDVLTVSGVDDMGVLASRSAWPSPLGSPIPPASYDARTGLASTVIREYVDINAGPSTLPERRVEGLSLAADPLAGATVTGRARYANLLDFVRDLCVRGGVNVTVEQQGRGLVFSVGVPRDLSGEVVLSVAGGSIGSAVIETSITAATHLTVGGQGELAARQLETVDTMYSPVRRIERFYDRRDLATSAELVAAGEAWLAENRGTVSLTIEPSATDAAVFGADYRIGDLIGVDLGDGVDAVRVIGVDAVVTPDGMDTSILVGSEPSFGESALMARLRADDRRLAALEAR